MMVNCAAGVIYVYGFPCYLSCSTDAKTSLYMRKVHNLPDNATWHKNVTTTNFNDSLIHQ